jgi:uncharacterized protein with HEPN domain
MEKLSAEHDKKDIETIIESCNRIEKVMAEYGCEEDFLNNHTLQSNCIFALIQIAESVKNLSNRRQNEFYLAEEWNIIAKFMDVLFIHHYTKVDLHTLWKTSAYIIPELKVQCETILKNLRD